MTEDNMLEALIGTTTSVATVVIERGPVAFFAEAVFDDDDVYRSPAAAAEAGFEAIPAPPTFPFVMESWGRFDELQPLGAAEGPGVMAALAPLMANGGLILHGEQSFHYHRPVRVGDRLSGTGTIVDAYAKDSKGTTMTFVVTKTVWADEATGEPVVTSTFNVIHRA